LAIKDVQIDALEDKIRIIYQRIEEAFKTKDFRPSIDFSVFENPLVTPLSLLFYILELQKPSKQLLHPKK